MARIRPDHFIPERVESLAIMYLTRREDLSVRREVRSDGVMDLMVEIKDPGRPAGWKKFGVYLQGTKSPVTLAVADAKMKLCLRRFFADFGEPSIPFCLFYFTMEDNKGYFAWIAEPTIDGGHFRLKYHESKADCVLLSDEVIDGAVDSVDRYYAAFYDTVIRS